MRVTAWTEASRNGSGPLSATERGNMPETPNGVVEAWLTQFDEALRIHNTDAALELFDDDCYWRDLVTFTWNIKTLEGKADIRGCWTRRWPTCSRATGPSPRRPPRPTA